MLGEIYLYLSADQTDIPLLQFCNEVLEDLPDQIMGNVSKGKEEEKVN